MKSKLKKLEIIRTNLYNYLMFQTETELRNLHNDLLKFCVKNKFDKLSKDLDEIFILALNIVSKNRPVILDDKLTKKIKNLALKIDDILDKKLDL